MQQSGRCLGTANTCRTSAAPLPVKRTFGRLMHQRRLTRNDETHPQRELTLRLTSNQTLSQGKALFEYLP